MCRVRHSGGSLGNTTLLPCPSLLQGWNDTTACPESDFYGGPYPCEWWAPVSGRITLVTAA